MLQFLSGVFFVYSALPGWMQHIAAIFPLEWMTQGLRAAFLPDAARVAEVARSREQGRTALILLAWVVGGIALRVRTFRWPRCRRARSPTSSRPASQPSQELSSEKPLSCSDEQARDQSRDARSLHLSLIDVCIPCNGRTEGLDPTAVNLLRQVQVRERVGPRWHSRRVSYPRSCAGWCCPPWPIGRQRRCWADTCRLSVKAVGDGPFEVTTQNVDETSALSPG